MTRAHSYDYQLLAEKLIQNRPRNEGTGRIQRQKVSKNVIFSMINLLLSLERVKVDKMRTKTVMVICEHI